MKNQDQMQSQQPSGEKAPSQENNQAINSPIPDQPTKPSKIPYLFFIFFGVVFGINILYIYVANKSWRGVTTSAAYQKGVEYNEVISQQRHQEELGWRVDMKYKRIDERTGALQVKLFSKNSAPITDANIRASFKRPTQEGYDFSAPLIFSEGVYQAKISFPLKGQWDVEIAASKGEENFYEVKRYVIQ